jgi:FKBP-type peptidyl-prolyl cis-trans isomerase SlpA
MPVRVQPGSFLTLHYRLSGPQGDLINTFNDKPSTLTLGNGELSPVMEECLYGLEDGARATFDLPAGAAFGDINPAMRQWLPAQFLREMGVTAVVYNVGEVVKFTTPDGASSYAGTVVEVGQPAGESVGRAVLFDFNHPLAGQPVTFEVQVIGIL